MEDKNQYLESLNEIRSIMERSSKLLSLTGLSGIAAGITAIISGTVASVYLLFCNNDTVPEPGIPSLQDKIFFLSTLAITTVFVAIGLALFFTRRNARKKNLPIWDNTAKLVVQNLAIPLCTGGLFILVLVFKFALFQLVVPSMLVFYGLALVNTSKFTVKQTRYLGIAEIVLGLTALLVMCYDMIFWIIGFGILHIVYGIVLYYKYERNK